MTDKMSPMSSPVERRDARRNWPVSAVSPSFNDDVALARSTSSEERLAMMWTISLDAWTMTGEEYPHYERHNMPGRLLSPDEP